MPYLYQSIGRKKKFEGRHISIGIGRICHVKCVFKNKAKCCWHHETYVTTKIVHSFIGCGNKTFYPYFSMCKSLLNVLVYVGVELLMI